MSANVPGTLRSFYVDNRPQLYTYALSLTRQRAAAEDAIQQAFQQLLRRDELPAEFRPYVFRCVRNAALDGLRRAAIRGDSIFVEERTAAEPVAPAAFPVRELDEAIRRLSPDEQEAIILKVYDGFTFQEIADLRGVSLPTVASWYRRGLEKLKALLKETR